MVTTDKERFIETLFRQEYQKLLLYAKAVTQDSPRSEDIVQDTFHEALRKKELLLHHENPQAWLMQTLKYKIQSSNRARERYLRRFLSLQEERGALDRNILRLEEEPEDIQTILGRIRQILTTEEYDLLKALVLEQKSHLQVAKERNISVWTSQKRLERIRKKLEKEFPQYQRKKSRKKLSAFPSHGNN